MSLNYHLITKKCELNKHTDVTLPANYKKRENSIYTTNTEFRTPGKTRKRKVKRIVKFTKRDFKPCHVTLLHVTPLHVTSYHASQVTSRHAMSCYVISRHASHVTPFHVISRHASHFTLPHVVSCPVTSLHFVHFRSSCHATPHHITTYNVKLSYYMFIHIKAVHISRHVWEKTVIWNVWIVKSHPVTSYSPLISY